jgi:hypothetical protein
MIKFICLTLISLFLSCRNHNNSDLIQKSDISKNEDTLKKSKKNIEYDEKYNDLYLVEKIDSLRDFYLIYAKKEDVYYKVVSEKIETKKKCKIIKKGDYLSLSLNSIIDTSKISYKVDGVLYKGTEFIFERDSIIDIYESNNLLGLCYLKQNY